MKRAVSWGGGRHGFHASSPWQAIVIRTKPGPRGNPRPLKGTAPKNPGTAQVADTPVIVHVAPSVGDAAQMQHRGARSVRARPAQSGRNVMASAKRRRAIAPGFITSEVLYQLSY